MESPHPHDEFSSGTTHSRRPWSATEYLQLIREARSRAEMKSVAASHRRSRVDIGDAAGRLLPPESRPHTPLSAYKILVNYAATRPDDVVFRRAKDPTVVAAVGALPAPGGSGNSSSSTLLRVDTAFRPSAFTSLEGDELLILVAELVAQIPDDRDREILRGRLGLVGNARTLEAIGADYGVSRERIRQRVKRSLKVLRTDARRRGSPGAVLRYLIDKTMTLDERTSRLTSVVVENFQCDLRTGLSVLLAAAGFEASYSGDLVGSAVAAETARRRAEDREDRNAATRAKRERGHSRVVNAWLDAADWPVERMHPPAAETLAARRALDARNNTGSFFSTKLNRPVRYESSLERQVFRTLEQSDLVVHYQEQPFGIPYRDGERDRIYFPDVFFATRTGVGVLVEVKPVPNMAIRENRLKAEAGRRWANSRGWGWITINGTRTQKEIERRIIPGDKLAAFRHQLLSAGILTWPDVLVLRARFGLNSDDITACIFQTRAELIVKPHYLIRLTEPMV